MRIPWVKSAVQIVAAATAINKADGRRTAASARGTMANEIATSISGDRTLATM
jgi:hypothetical protein